MRKVVLAVLASLLWIPSVAQVKSLYLEARLGYGAGFNNASYSGAFQADPLNLVLGGDITPSLSGFWRQRFSKPVYNPSIPLNGTDMLWLKWQINSHWAIQPGKIPVIVGGYEFDDAPVDLYYWDSFAGRLVDVYALGGNIIYNPVPEQSIKLQITQSLLGFGRSDIYHAALLWYGQFAPWWHTIWSVNWMDDPTRTGLGIIGLGNRLEFGPMAFEIDLNYRTGLKNLPMNADFGIIAKAEYTLPIMKIFAKGGYTRNNDCAVDVVPTNYSFTYAGGGVEVFPLRNDDLRLHAVGWWNTDVNCANFCIGVTYRLRLVKKDSSTSS